MLSDKPMWSLPKGGPADLTGPDNHSVLYNYNGALFHGTKAVLQPGDVINPTHSYEWSRYPYVNDKFAFATPDIWMAYNYARKGGGSQSDYESMGYIYEVRPTSPAWFRDMDNRNQYLSEGGFTVVQLITVVDPNDDHFSPNFELRGPK